MKVKTEQKEKCKLCGKEVILKFTEYIDEPSDIAMTFDGGGCFYKDGVYHDRVYLAPNRKGERYNFSNSFMLQCLRIYKKMC